MANHIDPERQRQIINLLVEGNSCRSIRRLTGAHLKTILRHLVLVGDGCQQLLNRKVRGLHVRHTQVDEIWTFCRKKQGKLTDIEKRNETIGDQYLFTALDTDSKMVVSHVVGKRTKLVAEELFADLAGRINLPPLGHHGDKPQLSTDGVPGFRDAVDFVFADTVNYGQVIKTFQNSEQPGRYGPPDVVATDRKSIRGIRDLFSICTSHVERNNLTIRTFMKRFTRLSLGFSKKLENLKAAVALHVAYYNFCWIHGTLKTTPAVAAGIATERWSLARLLEEI